MRLLIAYVVASFAYLICRPFMLRADRKPMIWEAFLFPHFLLMCFICGLWIARRSILDCVKDHIFAGLLHLALAMHDAAEYAESKALNFLRNRMAACVKIQESRKQSNL